MNNLHRSLLLLASLAMFSSIVSSLPSPDSSEAWVTDTLPAPNEQELISYGAPDQYPKLYSKPKVDRFLSDLNRQEYEGLKALDMRHQLGAPLWRAAIMVLMHMEPDMLEGFRDPKESFTAAYDRQFGQRCEALLMVFNKNERFLTRIVKAPRPVPYKAEVLYRMGHMCRELVKKSQFEEIYQHYVESSIYPEKNKWRFRDQLNPN